MRTPRKYQSEAAARASYHNLYIAFQCGLGKTLTAVEACKRAKPHAKSKRVLIVVSPRVVLAQWKREIELQDPGVPVYLVTNEEPFAAIDMEDECYVVTYYEMLLDPEVWRFTLARTKWGVVVADEAHKLRNRDAKRTEKVKALLAERRIAMSGTPMDQSPAELWAVLNWLDKERFSSYWRFVGDYLNTITGFAGPEPGGVKAERRAELSALLREYMVFRSRAQVAPELPKKLVYVHRVDLPPAQRGLYRAVRQLKDVEVDIGTSEPLWISNVPTHITRLQQLAAWPGLLGRPDLPSGKMDWVAEYVANNPQETMVVFTRFRGTAIELHRRLNTAREGKRRMKAALVIGERKPELLDEFISGRGDVRVLVGTIDAMGTALDLPMASTAIFMEMHWSSIVMRQAADRIHRLTTTEPPNIIFLLASGTVDWLLYYALINKLTEVQMFEHMMKEDELNYDELAEQAASALD